MLLVWLLHVLAVLAFISIRRHAKAEELRSQWDVLLTPKGRQTLDAIAEETEVDAKLLNDAFRHALRSRVEGRGVEAVGFLRLACRVVEWTTPRKLDRLRAMRQVTRMAAALLPAPPLRGDDFKSNRVAVMVTLARWLHYALVTGGQRFRLRLVVLAEGFKMTLFMMKRSARDAELLAKAWDTFAAASEDFKTLDRRHLEAMRMLLEGRVAYQRSVALAEAVRTP